ALGNFLPSDPPVADPSFYHSPRYIRDARSDAALAGLSPDDSILLVGSGLTAVDIAIALRDSNHKGKIHAVSRRGLLSQAHKLAPPASVFLSPDTAPKNIRSLLKLIRQEVRAANSRGQDWRPIIDSLRPISQQLWQNLPSIEQQRFMRHLRPYWEIHRHRAAPEIATAIAQMQQSKQLTVQAGCILNYREITDGVKVLIRDRHTGQQTIFTANRVINCTGSESDCRKLQHPLTANLLEQGLIRPDRLGLGLDTASNGALISAGDAVSKLLYTLGPPRKGSLWETTAVPEIRLQAANLASELIS
ncbi:MAG TPA: hydroxyacylglutathione hydrolase, partial [Kamptonema sp.]|nr:hydroxyacylglutathione hydrolase [Kamptonema sp.]